MLYNPIAQSIRDFESHGLIHPQPVQRALDNLEIVESTDVIQPPSLAKLNTEADIRKAIKLEAEYTALTEGNQSPLFKARATIGRRLEAVLVREFKQCSENYFEQLRPRFDQAAQVYKENVSKLPNRVFGSADVIGFDAETAVAYRAVVDAAKTIVSIRNLVNEIATIAGDHLVGSADPNHLILRADDVAGFVYVQLRDGYSTAKGSRIESCFLDTQPVIRYALLNGIDLELRTSVEANQTFAELEPEYQMLSSEMHREISRSLLQAE